MNKLVKFYLILRYFLVLTKKKKKIKKYIILRIFKIIDKNN